MCVCVCMHLCAVMCYCLRGGGGGLMVVYMCMSVGSDEKDAE